MAKVIKASYKKKKPWGRFSPLHGHSFQLTLFSPVASHWTWQWSRYCHSTRVQWGWGWKRNDTVRDRKGAYLGEATYIPVLSQSSKPSIQPHGKERGWATWISSNSYLNCSSSLHNLLGRGVIFLTLQTGKERDPRFDGFIKTMWTVTENLF